MSTQLSPKEMIAQGWNKFSMQAARDALAADGKPPQSEPLTEADGVRLWRLHDPNVDIPTLAMQIQPKILEMLQSNGMEPTRAQEQSVKRAWDYANLKKTPFRWKLIADNAPTHKERLRNAQKWSRLAGEQEAGERAEIEARFAAGGALPTPALPAPMPEESY